MRFGWVKNALLSLLVAASLVLSWVLWQGNWLRDADVAVIRGRSLAAADSPDLDQAIQPQITIWVAKPALATVLAPGTTAWESWYARLRASTAGPFRPVTGPAPTDALRVAYQFPVSLDSLPNSGGLTLPAQLPFAWVGDTVWLVQAQDGMPVYLEVRTQAGWYGAPLGEPAVQVQSAALQAVEKAPWVPLVTGGDALVPKSGLWLPVSTWSVQDVPLPQLVHAFFVNPEVATRIQSGPGTVMWTDGSRVVRYESGPATVWYEDPAVAEDNRAVSPTVTDLETAAAFLRNHGGAPVDARLWPAARAPGGGSNDIVFRDWIDGYPVLDAAGTYRVTVANGQVIRCQVPAFRLAARKTSVSVRVLDAQALRAAIRRNWPKANLAQVTVTLGYRTVPAADGMRLVPTYNVAEGSTVLGALDAASGDVIRGWTGP